MRAKSVVPFGVKNVIRQVKTQLHVLSDTRITGEALHTRERHMALMVELTLILFHVRCTTLSKTARSASSNRDEELADRVLKDTTITKRQLDLATRLLLEHVSRLSGW